MKKIIFQFLFLFVLMMTSQKINAQGATDADAGFEYSFHMGRLLPNQVDGATEILPLWGVRLGYNLPGDGPTVEAGMATGSGEGVSWNNLHLGMRSSMKVEDLLGIVYFGGDFTKYEGVSTSSNSFGGGHVGGGVMSKIGRSTWVRADMKFSVTPGTSLYISVGLLFR